MTHTPQLPANALDLASQFVVAIQYRDLEHTRHAPLVTIEYRGPDVWAVCAFGQCMERDGSLERYEGIPSGRSEEFIAATRFSLAEAFEVARRGIPKLIEEMGPQGQHVKSLLSDLEDSPKQHSLTKRVEAAKQALDQGDEAVTRFLAEDMKQTED